MLRPEQSPQTVIPDESSWKEHSSGLASVSVFLTDGQGRLLMVQDIDHNGGKWSPIAGFIDDLDHEEPKNAVLREAKEELGLKIRLDTFLGVWHYYDTMDHDTDTGVRMHVGYAFTGTIVDGTFTPQTNEIQNYGFFTPDEVEIMYQAGLLKTPQYNYEGFKLWRKGTGYPLEVLLTNHSING